MGTGRRMLEGRNGRNMYGVTDDDIDGLRKQFETQRINSNQVKKKAMFVVKRRATPMLAAIVVYNENSGRKGKVLASEPIRSDFSNSDLIAAARRLASQLPDYDVVLPVGIDL